ncbi:hypothetical protein DWF04_005900 [Cereibacter sphaeroides f. sp. denitrificans]|nr:hypothetical protein DWF04_06285 [Cereibacter sphaeroides f. sp. denitrificans]
MKPFSEILAAIVGRAPAAPAKSYEDGIRAAVDWLVGAAEWSCGCESRYCRCQEQKDLLRDTADQMAYDLLPKNKETTP